MKATNERQFTNVKKVDTVNINATNSWLYEK